MKQYTIALLILVSLLVFNSSVYANTVIELADSEIKTAIEADYQQHYADTLDVYKESFNTQANISFHEAALGDGIAFYKISAVEGSNSLQFAGYKFPLYLNGKQVCIIDATTEFGQWKISNISNHSDFEKKFSQMKAINSTKEQAQIRYIDDRSYDAQYAYINDSTGERYIELNTNKSFSPKEFLNKVENIKNNPSLKIKADGTLRTGFGGEYPTETKNTLIIQVTLLFTLGVMFLVPVWAIWKKSSKKAA